MLAISSGGGHWLEMVRVRAAFDGCEVVWATVHPGYAPQVAGDRFFVIPDATRWNRLRLIRLAFRVLFLLIRLRPDVVFSAGAAPGYLAVRMGKWVRARTIWLDSIANVEELSLSGQMAGKHADLWLTQWEHLARPEGPHFRGAVL